MTEEQYNFECCCEGQALAELEIEEKDYHNEVLADDEEEAIEEARLYFCENHYYLHDYINLTSCNICIDKPL